LGGKRKYVRTGSGEVTGMYQTARLYVRSVEKKDAWFGGGKRDSHPNGREKETLTKKKKKCHWGKGGRNSGRGAERKQKGIWPGLERCSPEESVFFL